MVFSSLFFLCVFLPLFFVCFYCSQIKSRKKVIVQFSVLFYAWGAPLFILFLIGSSIFDYFISKYLPPKNTNRKLFLWISLILNIALLAYFKYANFFVFAMACKWWIVFDWILIYVLWRAALRCKQWAQWTNKGKR